jgi:hypothetical protein
MDLDHVQTVIEIQSEAAIFDRALKILVGCGDYADIGPDAFPAADAFELSLLQHAQQSHLKSGCRIADFVQKKGAAIGTLEPPLVNHRCAGEGPFLVSEQFRFEDRLRQGRAIGGDEGFIGTGAEMMHQLRDDLLSAARFSPDQHGHVGSGKPPHGSQDISHHKALAEGIVLDVRTVPPDHVKQVVHVGLGWSFPTGPVGPDRRPDEEGSKGIQPLRKAPIRATPSSSFFCDTV